MQPALQALNTSCKSKLKKSNLLDAFIISNPWNSEQAKLKKIISSNLTLLTFGLCLRSSSDKLFSVA